MRLGEARICINCDAIHDQKNCPICGSPNFAFLQNFIGKLYEEEKINDYITRS